MGFNSIKSSINCFKRISKIFLTIELSHHLIIEGFGPRCVVAYETMLLTKILLFKEK